MVSIHAPAKGATQANSDDNLPYEGFNPRAREGRDGIFAGLFLAKLRFQSTRPRRARLTIAWTAGFLQTFQSTRPRRARLCILSIIVSFMPFQSTRPRRARHDHRRLHLPRRDVSIHAPAKGATFRTRRGGGREPSFNPRAREGRDSYNYAYVAMGNLGAPRGACNTSWY